jgi:uncharacterized protein (DUF58 family)
MKYGSGPVRKIDYAKILAASLSYFSYKQRDGVGLLTFDAEVRDYLPASRRAGQLPNILHVIDRSEPGAVTEFRKPLRYLAEILNRRGMIILISDLYDEVSNIMASLKQLKSKGNDIIVFHVMDDYELRFPFDQWAQFEDLETGKKLHVIPEYLREQYLKIVNDHMSQLRKEMSANAIDYTLIDTSKPLDQALFDYMAARSRTV